MTAKFFLKLITNWSDFDHFYLCSFLLPQFVSSLVLFVSVNSLEHFCIHREDNCISASKEESRYVILRVGHLNCAHLLKSVPQLTLSHWIFIFCSWLGIVLLSINFRTSSSTALLYFRFIINRYKSQDHTSWTYEMHVIIKKRALYPNINIVITRLISKLKDFIGIFFYF